MLLGLATIFAGSLDDYFNRPRAVGFILLFCLFTLTHINRDIESGLIARGQAELLVYTDNFVKTFNGTCFLSSREQLEVVTLFKKHSHYIPWFTTLFFAVFHGGFETCVVICLWVLPRVPRYRDPRVAEAAKHPLLLKAISVAIVAWGFRDRLPTECHWFSCPLSLFVK